MCSPYMFGRSPRIYASNVRLSTVAQDRSRISSLMSSTHSSAGLETLVGSVFTLALVDAPDVGFGTVGVMGRAPSARPAFSALMNRFPRSGQSRAGSKGTHLCRCTRSGGHMSPIKTRRTRSCGSGRKTRRGRSCQTRAPLAVRMFPEAVQKGS